MLMLSGRARYLSRLCYRDWLSADAVFTPGVKSLRYDIAALCQWSQRKRRDTSATGHYDHHSELRLRVGAGYRQAGVSPCCAANILASTADSSRYQLIECSIFVMTQFYSDNRGVDLALCVCS
jgi:hypothetical protein